MEKSKKKRLDDIKYTVTAFDFTDDEYIGEVSQQRNERCGVNFKVYNELSKEAKSIREFSIGDYNPKYDDDVCLSENNIKVIGLCGGFQSMDLENPSAEIRQSLYYFCYYWESNYDDSKEDSQ